MLYGVYYRWSNHGQWSLAEQFRGRQRAEALIVDMIAVAIRRGFNPRLSNLGNLAIVRLDLELPYGEAPKFLTEGEAEHRLGPARQQRETESMELSTVAIVLGKPQVIVLDGQHRSGHLLEYLREPPRLGGDLEPSEPCE